MIRHLTVERALRQADGDRELARSLIRVGILAEAERDAVAAGCSLKCRAGHHADLSFENIPIGCSNDGSTCICRCHDQNGAAHD